MDFSINSMVTVMKEVQDVCQEATERVPVFGTIMLNCQKQHCLLKLVLLHGFETADIQWSHYYTLCMTLFIFLIFLFIFNRYLCKIQFILENGQHDSLKLFFPALLDHPNFFLKVKKRSMERATSLK